jgi:hypothetical protein
VCREGVETVRRVAGSEPIEVLDMNVPAVEAKAKEYGVRTLPAVVIDGKLAECCMHGGVDENVVAAAFR